MHKKITIAALAAAALFGLSAAAGAQTATATGAQPPTASTQHTSEFAATRRVLASSNLCEWYRHGGISWDYAGQQTIADWTAATQAVTGELRKADPTLTGDALDRAAEQRITELCQPTHTAGAI
jgi:hypothetical protein